MSIKEELEEEGEVEESQDILLSLDDDYRKRSKPNTWKNLGSDEEILRKRVVNHRDLIKMRYSKKRKYFGKLTQHTTTDASDSYKFCTSVVDPNFTVFKKEREFGVQNVVETENEYVQTQRYRQVNKTTQVVTEDTYVSTESYDKNSVGEFVSRVGGEFLRILQQCSLVGLFLDDFSLLGSRDSFIGRKSASVLKEHQSFTHVEYSKNKILSCIDWQPNSKGVIAFSCLNSKDFASYLTNYGKSQTSYVVVWNFSDPIYPQVVLKSPCDILCLKFNPERNNIIVGGAITGQVVMWDLNEDDKTFKYSLKNSDFARDHIKTIKWKQISLVEMSHKSSVNDIQWLPEKNEISFSGQIIEKKDQQTNQFLTVSADGKIIVWDIRKNNLKSSQLNQKKKNEKYKDAWFPFCTYNLIHHGDLSEVSTMSFVFDKKNVQKLYCTSQDGDFVICNINPKKTLDKKKTQSNLNNQPGFKINTNEKFQNILTNSYRTRDGGHFGLSSKIDLHPIFNDIVLTVGDWTIKIWKIGQKGPLWNSPFSSSLVTCGLWSPTRPAVAYVGREDGTIEVWDFVDKSSEPSMIFNVTQAKITAMSFRNNTGKSKLSVQYLAVGSSVGTLHIINIPMNLIRPSSIEEENFKQFLVREEERLKYYQERWEMHNKKKTELEFEKEKNEKNEKNEKKEKKKEIKKEKSEIVDVNYSQIVKKFQRDLKKYSEDESLLFQKTGK